MKNIKQICYQTVADLYENDREFLVRIVKGEEQVMLFSKDSLESGRTVLKFVSCLQDNKVVSYALDIDMNDIYNIVIKLAE